MRGVTVKWIEIIKIRGAAGSDIQPARDMIRNLDATYEETRPTVLKMYRHIAIEGDLSIHMYWNSEAMQPQKTRLGLRIVDAFGNFCMVNHSVWIEEMDM
jgi:hypothetical protein